MPGNEVWTSLARALLQDDGERFAAKLVGGEAGHSSSLLLGDRGRIDGAKEEIQKPLTRCRVVEDVSHQRGLRGLLDEVAESCARGIDSLEKEGVERGVPADQLRRMQIPALIESADERML